MDLSFVLIGLINFFKFVFFLYDLKRYGFIKAKMTRVKMFHNYIWGLATGDSDEGLPPLSPRYYPYLPLINYCLINR
jgi:hypothetical protein